MTKHNNIDPRLRKPSALMGLVLAGSIALTGCGESNSFTESGYSDAQKAEFAAVAQPVAAKVAELALGNATTSSIDEKTSTLHVYVRSPEAPDKSHYEASITLSNTGGTPDPNAVQEVRLEHWSPNVQDPTKATIDKSITLSGNDGINRDPYWSVTLLADGPGQSGADAANDTYLSNMPRPKTILDGDQSGFNQALGVTKLVAGEVQSEFIPELFPTA